jgi:hypothetical protein
MIPPVEAPLQIRKAIEKRLQKRGVLKQIERKIKLGMMVAVEELRQCHDGSGTLDRRKFKDAPPSELRGLQLVYNFLDSRNLIYTLGALREESATARTDEPADILDVVRIAPRTDRQRPDEDDGYATGSDDEFETPLTRGTAPQGRAPISTKTFD